MSDYTTLWSFYTITTWYLSQYNFLIILALEMNPPVIMSYDIKVMFNGHKK